MLDIQCKFDSHDSNNATKGTQLSKIEASIIAIPATRLGDIGHRVKPDH